jgi:hypothetical protein
LKNRLLWPILPLALACQGPHFDRAAGGRLQDHIVGACELKGASARTFPSQKTQSLPSVPVTHSHSVKTRLFANPVNEFSRILPGEDEFACSFMNVDGNLVADHARRDRRHVSARDVGCRKEAVLLLLLLLLLLPGIERWAVLPTEHFSQNEDEYCSANAAAQEQIQQGIACCG